MPLVPDPMLAGFAATRAALENSADTFSVILDIGTFAVVIGVIAEFAALIWEVREEKRLAASPMLNAELITALPKKYRISTHTRLSFIGCALVALGVTAELWAAHEGATIESRLRKNNAAEQTELLKRANDATAKAAALADRVGGFDALVKQTDYKVDALMATASDQKARSDTIIASLNAKQREVVTTIEAAKMDEAELAASVNTIKDLRQTLHGLTTKRVLTEQQVKELTKQARPFAKKEFDMAANHDSDSPYLARQIGEALKNAGWEWAPRNDLGSVVFHELPAIGSAFSTGLQVDICKSEEHSMAPAVNALYMGLKADGIELTHDLFVDGEAAARNEPCGKIHIVVGSRM
jgi:hypothetical protein